MGPITAVAIFLTIWWTVLFAVLPWGVRSYHEAEIEVMDGGDPGAPVNPRLKTKFAVTTLISAILLGVLYGVIKMGWLTLPAVAQTY